MCFQLVLSTSRDISRRASKYGSIALDGSRKNSAQLWAFKGQQLVKPRSVAILRRSSIACGWLQDSDERACAYIAGPAPQRWGNFSDDVPTMPAGQVRLLGAQRHEKGIS